MKRVYDSETSTYVLLPGPWAGAPKGIRVISRNGYYGVYTDTEVVWADRNEGFGGLHEYRSRNTVGLQRVLENVRGMDYTFPDFDGAPEGHRFFVKLHGKWHPRVEHNGQVWVNDGGWREMGLYVDRKGYDNPGKHLFSHGGVVDVDEWPKPESVLKIQDRVNEALGEAKAIGTHGGTKLVVHHDRPTDEPSWLDQATERLYFNDWKSSAPPKPEIRPGDVIRNLDNGALWYALPKSIVDGSGIRSYQQIGMRDTSSPMIVKARNFVVPERFAILSRAVAQ